MTQIKTKELARIVCPPGEKASIASLPFPDLAVMGTVFMAGLLAARLWRNRRGRRKSN